MTVQGYTAATKRQITAERIAASEARNRAAAAMTAEEYVTMKVSEVADMSTECQDRQRTWAIARHAELVESYAGRA